jgi:ribonuclease HII
MAPFRAVPTLTEEIRGWRNGFRHVAGIDEVGRGPMAGPVVAGAVILDPQFGRNWWAELRDSKTLTAAQRARLAERLHADADAVVATGLASHEEVDDLGLLNATKQAMLRALDALPCTPDLLLIDAVSLPEYGGAAEQRSLIHGDGLCLSIAAASIVAKVERDRLMDQYDRTYPSYGFANNKGYCTRSHLQALDRHGPCPIHRRSFAPVRAHIERTRSTLHAND